jgi:two-component system cell cycle sensor histidine kinase/response regulator CckA
MDPEVVNSGPPSVPHRRRAAPSGKPPELASLAHNLENRRWSEEAPRTAADVIVTIGQHGEVLFISPSAENLFGYSTPDMLGRGLNLLLPGYGPGEAPNGYQPREMAGRHKDGHSIPLEVAIGQFTQGSRTFATGILRDISPRKREEAARRGVEEQLRRANETLRALTEATPLAIVTFDSSENVSKWSSAAEKMFGWSETEMLGRPLPLGRGDDAGRLRLVEAGRKGESLETVSLRKDGPTVDISVTVAPLSGPDGSPAGVVAVIADITERKRLEDQLQQAQKLCALGRLASGIAHDFNNLLTVIIGYDEMLLNGLDAGSRPKAYAQEILHSAEKASALTKQLLSFGRRQSSNPALLDINPVIANLSNMLRRLIGEEIELVILAGQNVGTVLADPCQIEQIVTNLTLNARDAMPGGGRITIETAVAGHFDEQPGRYVTIAVTDTGHGMTQGAKTPAIYGIVKQNDGDIRVDSEPGKGSTFKVYLPAVDELPETSQACADTILRCGKETILVAEDEAGLRVLIQEQLERLGYTVLIAAGSQEAIRIASVHPGPIHLLLADVVMPKANGRELAEKLRYLRRQTRVLYMSGYPSETVLQHGVLRAGVDFLEKPFTLEALAKKVREALDASVVSPARTGA